MAIDPVGVFVFFFRAPNYSVSACLLSRSCTPTTANPSVSPRQETEEESKDRLARFDVDHRASSSSSSSSSFALGTLIRSAGLVSGGSTGVPTTRSLSEAKAGPLEQFRLLLARSWRQVNRAKFANATRVSTSRGEGGGGNVGFGV